MGASPRKPSIEDVMNVTALRHYAIAIERRSVDLYITNPELFSTIKKELTQVLEAFKNVEETVKQEPPSTCVFPWVLCDNVCRLEEDCS